MSWQDVVREFRHHPMGPVAGEGALRDMAEEIELLRIANDNLANAVRMHQSSDIELEEALDDIEALQAKLAIYENQISQLRVGLEHLFKKADEVLKAGGCYDSLGRKIWHPELNFAVTDVVDPILKSLADGRPPALPPSGKGELR